MPRTTGVKTVGVLKPEPDCDEHYVQGKCVEAQTRPQTVFNRMQGGVCNKVTSFSKDMHVPLWFTMRPR